MVNQIVFKVDNVHLQEKKLASRCYNDNNNNIEYRQKHEETEKHRSNDTQFQTVLFLVHKKYFGPLLHGKHFESMQTNPNHAG